MMSDLQDTKRNLQSHWLFGPMWQTRWTYAQVGVAAFVINLFSLATSIFVMVVYDRVLPSITSGHESLIALVIGMVIILTFDFILKSLRGYFIDLAGHRIDSAVGGTIYKRLLDMRLSNRKGTTGGFAGLLREFETLREFFASATLAALVDVPFILIFLIVIAVVGGSVVWVPIIAIPIVLIAGWLVQAPLKRLSATSMQQGFNKQGVLVETIAGLETIKTSAGSAMLEQRWADAVDNHAEVSRRSRSFTMLALNVAGTVQQFAYVGVVVYGVLLIAKNEMTMGGLIAASMLASRCMAPLSQIATLLSRLTHTQTAYQQLDAMMGQDGETKEKGGYLRRTKLEGSIEFRNVIFRYPGSTVRALDDVSFRIEPGEKVAILGRIGSGKSTITRLVSGLYEPSEGAVLIDDTDVRQIHPYDLRHNVGSVLQDVVLLSGTVRENIVLRDAKASDDEVLRVSKVAGVHDFIGTIPNGYDVRLADRGEGLSGGQKQSIAISRALLGSPPLMLLDEPTAAMDVNTENALIARLETELEGRTLVLITHRSSLLKLVDRIIILDRGKIIAQGPRDDVLRAVATGGA
jgi:ATP-binding cassette, subfamily C, bacterial LapB